VLKIHGIPVRVFIVPISGFSASTFGETPQLSSPAGGCGVTVCLPDTGFSIEKQIECVGLRATITNVLMRVQMLDGRDLTTLVRPSHRAAQAWHARDHIGVCGKCQRDRVNYELVNACESG